MDSLSPDGVPRILPGYPVDKITALMATQAVLAALYERERTGRGERIDLAMLDAAASVKFPDLFTNRVFCTTTPRIRTTVTSSRCARSPQPTATS